MGKSTKEHIVQLYRDKQETVQEKKQQAILSI